MNKFPQIADANGIKLYVGDVVEDGSGEKWILVERNGMFVFQESGRQDRCVPYRYSGHFALKYGNTK